MAHEQCSLTAPYRSTRCGGCVDSITINDGWLVARRNDVYGKMLAGGQGMESTNTLDTPANVDAEYEVAIDRYLHEMERLRDDMEARQQRIEQMQAETQALLAQLEQLRAA
jgi:hypothetical protein